MCQENIFLICWPAMPGENDIPEQSRILHHYAKLISNGARDLVHYLWSLNATNLAHVFEVGMLWTCVAATATNCKTASLIWKVLQHRLRNIARIWKKPNSKVHQQTFSGLFVGRSHGYEDDFLEHWPNRPTADFQESWTVINRIWNVKVQNVNHCEIISFQLEKGMIWICKRLFWMIMCTRTNPARGTLPTHKFAVLNQSWIVRVKTAMVWTWIVTLFAAKNNLLVKINVK